MVRRTKEEAQETRNQILDAAENLFYQRGVANTALDAIAQQAGITRGAIYWHFKDKADLFNAMMDRIIWPFRELPYNPIEIIHANSQSLITMLCEQLRQTLELITTRPQIQRLLYIAEYQIELTPNMEAVRNQMLECYDEFFQRTLTIFSAPAICNKLTTGITPEDAACTMQNAIIGTISQWLLKPDCYDLIETGLKTQSIILHGVGLSLPQDIIM